MNAEMELTRHLPLDAGVTASASQATAAEQSHRPGPPSVRILPARGWQPLNVGELWEFRELVYFLTWRDVKVRYKQTALGAAWAVLQPAMMMVVFTILFGRMVKVDTGGLPYPVFAYLGLVLWTFFSTAIGTAGNSVVGQERLITKIYFPRLAVPFAAVGAAVVDFFIASSLVAVLMIWYGIHPGLQAVVVLPLVFVSVVLLAAGVGTLLAALNVHYRDFRYVIPFLVQLWLFGTPSVYMKLEAALAGKYGALLSANPMTWLIATFRDACTNQPIHWGRFGLSSLLSVVVFLAGCMYFRRMERNFADTI
jgi:lipopolysaccharide transport system permease protein